MWHQYPQTIYPAFGNGTGYPGAGTGRLVAQKVGGRRITGNDC